MPLYQVANWEREHSGARGEALAVGGGRSGSDEALALDGAVVGPPAGVVVVVGVVGVVDPRVVDCSCLCWVVGY
jgi:hypothetical protein